jgi:hypothetical protein
MGTLQTVVTRALVNVRGQNKHIWAQKDAQVLGIVNRILESIRATLQLMESNLVYSAEDITLVSGTMEYTPSNTWFGVMDDGVWLDDEQWFLVQGAEADKVLYDYQNSTGQPDRYYLTEDGKIGFLYVPDGNNTTAHVMYWKPLTEMTALATDNLPWYGIWNGVVQDLLEMKLNKSQEKDVTIDALESSDSFDLAVSMTLQRGVRQRKINSGFFDLDGI